MVLVKLADYVDRQEQRKKISAATAVNYRRAIAYTGIDQVDSDNLVPTWNDLSAKLKAGVSYFHIHYMTALIQARLRMDYIDWKRSREYDDLIDDIKEAANAHKPEGYDLNSVRVILNILPDDALKKAVVLMAYGGLRIGACKDLKYAAFKLIEPEGVYVFDVKSKGKVYTAAISKIAYKYLTWEFGDLQIDRYRHRNVVEFDDSGSVPFNDLLRMQFKRYLINHGKADLKKNRVSFHSFRKFFSDTLRTDGLLEEEIGYLLGHSPRSLAWKHYTDKSVVEKRVAAIYAKTSFNKLDLFDRKEINDPAFNIQIISEGRPKSECAA